MNDYVRSLEERGYSPLVYKMFNFSSLYRKKINFTFEALESSKVALKRLKDGYTNHLNGKDIIDKTVIEEYKKDFLEAVNDDLNMPQAMSVVWDVIKYEKKSKQLAEVLLDFDKVLGLKIDEKDEEKTELPEEILKLVELRKQARTEKNWALSDELRDKIISLGYNVKDTKDGMEVEAK